MSMLASRYKLQQPLNSSLLSVFRKVTNAHLSRCYFSSSPPCSRHPHKRSTIVALHPQHTPHTLIPYKTPPNSLIATAVITGTRSQATIAQSSPPHPNQSTLPKPWSRLPSAIHPFIELSRFHSPSGAIYLFFPCVFSTLLAALSTLNPALVASASGTLALSSPSLPSIVYTTALFLSGSLIMRGAGCTINDLWDRNLDPHVARTRRRPLARRAISPLAATSWFGAQCLAGLVVLLQFPQPATFLLATPSLLLVTTYPLAKRVTHYPQFVLGLAFSWGSFLGWPALSLPFVDLLHPLSSLAASPEIVPSVVAAALLYSSCTVWTLVYDMIYAFQDIKDDKSAGIKSIALKHQGRFAKHFLSSLSVVQISLLAASGYMVGAGPLFYIGSCGGGAVTLAWMIRRVNLGNAADCWWWFRRGCWFTGAAVTFGMLGDYLMRIGIAEMAVEHIGT